MTYLRYIIASVLAAATAGAQGVSVTASLSPSVIGLREQAVLTVKVSGSGKSVPDPVLPKTDAVSFYPSGNSSSFQFVNGSMSVSKQLTYTVVPAKTGKFTLGSVTVSRKGKTASSAPVVITVKEGAVAGKGQAPGKAGGAAPAGRGNGGGGKGHDIFIKTRINRGTAYVNQQVTLTYELYANVNLSGVSFSKQPSLTGFWTEDLAVPKGKEQSVVNLNGQRYLRVILKKMALFPVAAGKVTIPGVAVNVQVDDFMNDPFAGFFSRRRRSAPREVGSDPVTVNVLPLPARGKPAGFGGAVGRFTLSAVADRKNVTAGDPVTVTVNVAGTGNIKTVPDPELPVLGDFETYESGSSVKTSNKGDVISGRKSYKYVFIPKSAGVHTIGALSLPYFDPVKKAYRTLTTQAVSITAAPGERTDEHVVVSARSKEAVKILDRDIRYIRTGPVDLRGYGEPLFTYGWFWLLQCLPAALVAGAFVYGRHSSRISTDVRYARNRRARGMARRRLKTARKLLDSGGSAACSAEVSKALSDYIGDKLNIAATGATTLQITAMLEEKGVPAALIETYRACFEKCDFARFAPSSVSRDDLVKTMADAEEAIIAMEREKLS